jgi:hypothetical protein
MRVQLFSGVCLVAIAAFPLTAMADAPVAAGTISAGYGQSSFEGIHVDNWNFAGQAEAPIGASNWAVQADASYNTEQVPGAHVDTTNGVVSAFYQSRAGMGRVGAAGGYGQLNLAGDKINDGSYGVFGDWYINPYFTASARFGAVEVSGSGINSTKEYGGAQLVGYALPDLAISATYDEYQLSDITHQSATLKGEWLVSKQMPVSLFASYSAVTFKEGATENIRTYMFGVKFYFGGGGSLRDRQRDGAESWGSSTVLNDLF